VRLPNQEMVNAVMLVVANHENGLADQWMKWIGNHSLECQKPGTMAPARTKVQKIGPAWRRWSRLASSITSIQWCISPIF
jgi:hypothetical protein